MYQYKSPSNIDFDKIPIELYNRLVEAYGVEKTEKLILQCDYNLRWLSQELMNDDFKGTFEVIAERFNISVLLCKLIFWGAIILIAVITTRLGWY